MRDTPPLGPNSDDLSFCVALNHVSSGNPHEPAQPNCFLQEEIEESSQRSEQNLEEENRSSPQPSLCSRVNSSFEESWKFIRYLIQPSERFTPSLDVENSLKGLILWNRAELFWSMGLFVFSGWFLFFVLGHLTETTGGVLREKVSGWLIFMAIILTCRTVSLSIIVEEFKWHKALIRTHDVRPSLITLLQSNRMAATRFFHVLYLLWWYFVPANLAASVIQEAAFFATSPPTPVPIHPAEKHGPGPGGGGSFNPSPEYYLALQILLTTVRVSRYFWAIEWIPVLFTVLYHFFKYRLTYADQLLVFSPPAPNQNLVILSFGNDGPGGGRPHPVPVPRRILKSFPLIIWPQSIDKGESVNSDQLPDEDTAGMKSNDASATEKGDHTSVSIQDGVGRVNTLTADEQIIATAFQSCTICLSQFIGGDVLRLLPCSHLFHKDCIDTWLSERANCPFRCDVDLMRPFSGRLSPATQKLPDSILRQLPQK